MAGAGGLGRVIEAEGVCARQARASPAAVSRARRKPEVPLVHGSSKTTRQPGTVGLKPSGKLMGLSADASIT